MRDEDVWVFLWRELSGDRGQLPSDSILGQTLHVDREHSNYLSIKPLVTR